MSHLHNKIIEELLTSFECKIVDFSEAQVQGFKLAFVKFMQTLFPDSGASDGALMERAAQVLKGCKQHFDASVTRVAKISGVIPVSQKAQFEGRAQSLFGTLDSVEWRKRCEAMI
jgi:hypothetical protein